MRSAYLALLAKKIYGHHVRLSRQRRMNGDRPPRAGACVVCAQQRADRDGRVADEQLDVVQA